MENLTNIKNLLFTSCCVLSYNGKDVGTGWVAPGNKIVSAGHLFINDETNDSIVAAKINTKRIIARFFSLTEKDTSKNLSVQTEYSLKFLCGAYSKQPLVDFCILEAEESIWQSPLPIADTICLDGVFCTAGYGIDIGRFSHAEGTITGLVAENGGAPSLKLSSQMCHQLGFSGCPTFAINVGGVIGIQSQKTKKQEGAESNTVLAYPIGPKLREALKSPLSFHGVYNNSLLDTAMSLRDEADQLFSIGRKKDAKICYEQAEKLLVQAVGKEGRYIDDIKRRINCCSIKG